jgi:hypothetical protein
MAMFPPAIPHVFIRWLTQPGDLVYDPFCGRGTTPLEACLLGRVGYGSDANPLACVLAGAKVDPPCEWTLRMRLEGLSAAMRAESTVDVPEHVRMLFAPRVLGQLLWLRRELRVDRKIDRFLLAVLLGSLHANADKTGTPRGLTVAMPNTFSMSPAYVARYIDDHRLEPPDVDLLDFLATRALRFEKPSTDFTSGAAWLQDATAPIGGPLRDQRVKLIFTSPPYLQVILYGKFNWIRLWLLGHEPREVDSGLYTSASLDRYLEFMSTVLMNLRARLRDDGYACLVIGDVRRGETTMNLAKEVAAVCVPKDLEVLGIVADELPIEHKVSRIWGDNKGRATKTDRILVLAGPKAPDPGSVGRIRW